MTRNTPIRADDCEITSYHSLGGFENTCELRKTPTVLYSLFVELARTAYFTVEGRDKGCPGALWNPDSSKTGIWIDTELRWEDEHPEFRPAVYVQLSQIQYDEPNPGFSNKISGADRFARREYARKVSGSVTYMHVARTVGEACALADNTDKFIGFMQDPIRQEFCFDLFRSAGRIPLAKLETEANNAYGSSATFQYSFHELWTVTEESPVLKTIGQAYSIDGTERVSGAVGVRPENVMAKHLKN